MSDGRYVQLFKRPSDGKWWWHVMGANDTDILSDSGQAYVRRIDAREMAESLNPGLPVVELDYEPEPQS